MTRVLIFDVFFEKEPHHYFVKEKYKVLSWISKAYETSFCIMKTQPQ